MSEEINQLFQLDRLTAWIAAKPSIEGYNYDNGRVCLLAQYFQENGFEDARATPDEMIIGGIDYPLPPYFDFISLGVTGSTRAGRFTFGAALERAGEARAQL
jgi:hypothetical protein